MGSRTSRGKHTSANILLGISLSVLLIASVIPFTYAVEGDATTSYTRFDGNDYMDVDSTPKLQLLQFTLEARFRISQMPTEPQFIVSKSAGTDGIFDKNYALFITKEGRVGGVFKADDGSEHAVYSDLIIVNSGWHTARVVYDGIKLKLKLDGINVDSKNVGKKPDVDTTAPLRIGADTGSPDNFFKGDLDYVKMLDRATFNKVYQNDFTGGSEPAPEPEPEPEPTPTPDPTSTGDDCDNMSMSKLRGAVFMDSVLGTRENGGSINMPLNYVRDSMKFMKANGMNLVRVPFYWEAYVHDPVAFLNELELIAQSAEANDMCVIFDNHHWYTTSNWDLEIIGNSDGRGFPSFVVKNFANRNNDYEDTAGPFWTAFLSNSISVNGRSVWDVQADFFAKVIGRVDKYDSVTGYEILNEPHLFSSSQYEKLGEYHTYMAKKIRSMTDKKIFFDRETARGFTREPSSEYKIVPRGVSGVVYGPHLYSVPAAGTQGEKQLANFAQWSKDWGMEILIGEWSAETSAETDVYLRAFEKYGFAWTYYAWKPTQSRGGGASLYDSPTADPTEALRQLQSSIARIYG